MLCSQPAPHASQHVHLPPLPAPPQELARGRSLADMVASGWRADEAEVSRIAGELLDILRYLGDRRPPVIHRWVGEGGSRPVPCLLMWTFRSAALLQLLLALNRCQSRLSIVPQGRQAREHCDRGGEDGRARLLGRLWGRAGAAFVALECVSIDG